MAVTHVPAPVAVAVSPPRHLPFAARTVSRVLGELVGRVPLPLSLALRRTDVLVQRVPLGLLQILRARSTVSRYHQARIRLRRLWTRLNVSSVAVNRIRILKHRAVPTASNRRSAQLLLLV